MIVSPLLKKRRRPWRTPSEPAAPTASVRAELVRGEAVKTNRCRPGGMNLTPCKDRMMCVSARVGLRSKRGRVLGRTELGRLGNWPDRVG